MMSTINEYTQAREGGDAKPRGKRQAIFCPIFQKKTTGNEKYWSTKATCYELHIS